MLINFTEIFPLKTIKAIIKINNIKYVSHLNKTTLLNILNNSIEEIFNHFNDSISPDNMINLIKHHIEASIGKSEATEYDLLLIGSMTKLNNRFHAANARSSNVPVISVSHGDGDQLMFDEPRFGYSERTYPNILFGYGPSGNSLNGARYLKCLFGVPKYCTSNSSVISKIYNNPFIKRH